MLTTGDGGGLMALADLESAVRVAGGRGLAVVWNDAAYGAEVNLYGLKGLADGPMLIPEVDFAALARAVGAEGVVVRTLDDLDALAPWAAEHAASDRPFLLLDCRISGDVIAPYQQEIIRVNSCTRSARDRRAAASRHLREELGQLVGRRERQHVRDVLVGSHDDDGTVARSMPRSVEDVVARGRRA